MLPMSNELLAAIVTETIRQQNAQAARATMKGSTKDPSPDVKDSAKKLATNVRNVYNAYVEAGFTAEQAFELTKAQLSKN